MPSLADSVMEQLERRGAVDQIARKLGVPPSQANSAVSAALPAILAGLAKNAQSPSGAASLSTALDKDHDGSVLDDDGYFDAYEQRKGDGILGHVFGEKKPAVESQVSALSGLNGMQGADLMKMLAPLIMGYLGQQKSSGGFDLGMLTQILGGGGSSGAGGLNLPGGLGEILGGMTGGAATSGAGTKAKPKSAGPGGLGSILGQIFGRKK